MITILVVLVLIILALLGAPLFSIIAAGALYGFYIADIDLMVIGIELYRIAETPLLMALPLFTFSGYLLSESNTSQRMLNLIQSMVGWMPGGLVIFAFIFSAIFTAFTGASGVTIVALGALFYPAFIKAGYTEKFSLGMVTSSGSLGLLLAPSLPLILYGIIAQQMELDVHFSINDLFIAGIMPAAIMIIALSSYAIVKNRQFKIKTVDFEKEIFLKALWAMRWELPMPILLIIGIYSGYFAISEAAALVAVYILVIETLIYKEVSFKKLLEVIRESMAMVGSILLILAVSLALTNVFIDAEVPGQIFSLIQENIDSKISFLIILNIFLLFIGAILDIFSALVIIVPLILPVAISFGIHPVHLGIIFLANMQIGYLTPPVGINLFISSYRFKKPIADVYKASLPFMLVLLIVLLLITYIPALSLYFI
ncbi:MAG: C4-dicarboxylate ABC transporter [endosymbiont of Galathealinum brachiosum]|uniref:TRAP transporter large permease protein n=1 Tax=endosymbiont of Galathealinum brachiosum TaxID=2200906 RepID=A0A370DCR5_9GAMM|nr:MAG: C4-dicarboxylate ABC transporter [endosymbiont of Galathealinum brachiosum]